MKRRILFTVSAALVVLAAVAVAQEAGAGRLARGQGRFGDGMRQRAAVILDLSDAQKAEWARIEAATRAKIEPLAAQQRANRAALQAEMARETADARRVGELMIANREIREQMRAAREQTRLQFDAILTPEQKAKHDELRALREERRGRRPGRREGGGLGMGPGAF